MCGRFILIALTSDSLMRDRQWINVNPVILQACIMESPFVLGYFLQLVKLVLYQEWDLAQIIKSRSYGRLIVYDQSYQSARICS